MAKYQDLGFSTFQIQIFLSFLVSHQKHFCFSKQIYFCLTKKILELIPSIEKKIYYKRQIQSLQEVGDFVKSRKIARPFNLPFHEREFEKLQFIQTQFWCRGTEFLSSPSPLPFFSGEQTNYQILRIYCFLVP